MQRFDPYHQWLGIPPGQQPPNHYRLLGVVLFEDDREAIEAAADQRAAHLQRYQSGPHVAWSQQLLNEVAAARVCLLNPGRKAAYDASLGREAESAGPGVLADDDLGSGKVDIEALGLTTPEGAGQTPDAPAGNAARRPGPVLLTAIGAAVVLTVLVLAAVWAFRSNQSLLRTSGAEQEKLTTASRQPDSSTTQTAANSASSLVPTPNPAEPPKEKIRPVVRKVRLNPDGLQEPEPEADSAPDQGSKTAPPPQPPKPEVPSPSKDENRPERRTTQENAPEKKSNQFPPLGSGENARLARLGQLYPELATLWSRMKPIDARIKENQKRLVPVVAAWRALNQQVAMLRNRCAFLQSSLVQAQSAERQGQQGATNMVLTLQASLNRAMNDLNSADDDLTRKTREKNDLESDIERDVAALAGPLGRFDEITQEWFALCDFLGRLGPEAQRHTVERSTAWLARQDDLPPLYLARGLALAHLGEHDRALADFDKLAQFDPRVNTSAFALAATGYVYAQKGNTTRAQAAFGRAEKGSGGWPVVYVLHGQAYVERQEYARAWKEFQKALDRVENKRVAPAIAEVYEAPARFLATCPISSLRDGKRAIRYAEAALKLARHNLWIYHDTLAAAYAEAGEFDQAVKHVDIALNLAPAESQQEIVHRKTLYEKNEPYRME